VKLVWWMLVVAIAFGLVLWWFLRPGRRAKREHAKRLPLDDEPPDRMR